MKNFKYMYEYVCRFVLAKCLLLVEFFLVLKTGFLQHDFPKIIKIYKFCLTWIYKFFSYSKKIYMFIVFFLKKSKVIVLAKIKMMLKRLIKVFIYYCIFTLIFIIGLGLCIDFLDYIRIILSMQFYIGSIDKLFTYNDPFIASWYMRKILYLADKEMLSAYYANLDYYRTYIQPLYYLFDLRNELIHFESNFFFLVFVCLGELC